MDIGVYCVHPAALLFGMPKAVHASCVKLSNGVDGAGSALLEYDGMTVEVLYSKIADGALGSEFQGEAGSLVVDHISVPQELTLHLRKQPPKCCPPCTRCSPCALKLRPSSASPRAKSLVKSIPVLRLSPHRSWMRSACNAVCISRQM